jgi:anaerobic magnesium-protoporphyrin IX monomethyl ester cyclase
MSKVLFTHSYFYKLDSKQWRFKQPYPPLATILAAAVVRGKTFDVSLFDTCLKDSPGEIAEALKETKPQYLVIYDDGFNYLTKMCLTVMRDAALIMAKEGKKLNCTVIVSSSDATDQYDIYLNNGVDFVIRGEGEETLTDLLEALDGKKDFSVIPGLAFKKDDSTVVTAQRGVIRNLDALPLPAWDLILIEEYKSIWNKYHGYFSINIATTRGCPFKCNWCAKPIYGNRYNSRSPESVVEEIELLIQKFSPDHFWMCDDIFGLKPGWIQRFNDLIKLKKINFNYKIQSRVDLLVQEDTVDALAESGVETIWVGAESGAQTILDAMDKGTTVDQIYQATRLLKLKGIKVAFFLQFGYPGETRENIDSTLKMLLDLMPDEVGISISYPLPGTKFYEKVSAQLDSKHNWKDSDDLDMMFQGTFTKNYYKQLHGYIHSVYRKHRGYASLRKLLRTPLRLTHKDIRSALATTYFIPMSFAQRIKLEILKTLA